MSDRPLPRVRRGLSAVAALWLAGVTAQAAAQTTSTGQVTFTKDIAPLLQRSCQRCHRPDSVAPMSLLTYEQARPYARAMKERTALARTRTQRGAMPPWFIDRTVGIQRFKDDISLSDAEIATFALWADAGAPMGDPNDMPPPMTFPGPADWTLGTPDLILTTPMVFVPAIGSDWEGALGITPTGLTEDRYLSSSEYKEWSDYDASKLPKGSGLSSRFVFHHNVVGIGDESIRDPNAVDREIVACGQTVCYNENGGGGGLPVHEVGRNGDVFPDEAGHRLPARSALVWHNNHVHSPGIPGAERYARMSVGLRFHPTGYTPKYVSTLASFGTTEIDIKANEDNQRVDSYWIAPQHAKLLNYEPHMHAGGVRTCMEAIYGSVIETLNCAAYDHNWLKTYYYAEDSQPLLPMNTILHTISWLDNTAKNENIAEPRNAGTFGMSSTSNMIIFFNRVVYLTDEQYKEELQEREAYLRRTGGDRTTCLECRVTPAPPAPGTAAGGGSQ